MILAEKVTTTTSVDAELTENWFTDTRVTVVLGKLAKFAKG